jgi:DNA-binding response OmpR family regulator
MHPNGDRDCRATFKERILIVEDEPDMRNLLKEIFEDRGFKVETVSSGSRALQVVLEFLPDLVVLDIMLPGMSGLDICAKMRQDFYASQ